MTSVRLPRLVLDTNVAVSAFLWGGKPAALIEMAGNEQVRLFTSRALVEELETTLTKPKLALALGRLGVGPTDLIARYHVLSDLVRPKPVPRMSRDPDDDHVIACALAARADFIITGDDDLLMLGDVSGVRIVTVGSFLENVRKMRSFLDQ